MFYGVTEWLSLFFESPLMFLIAFGGLVVSLTVHEFAHAFLADKLGDPTPRIQGRVTLNPLAHLDPLGTIVLLLTRFGWGKPVQFDPYNLKNPVRDGALIALAGPASNLVMATLLSLVIRAQLIPSPLVVFALAQVIVINIVLAIFNFIPVHPLDGSKVMMALLPRHLAEEYEAFMTRYGLFFLILLIFPFNGTSPVSALISPVINAILKVLLPVSLL